MNEEAGVLYTADQGGRFSNLSRQGVSVEKQSQAVSIWEEEVLVDIFCTHLHLSRGMLCRASEPHPRRKVLPFLHGSEALGSLTWPARVNNTHLLGTTHWGIL